MIDENSKSEEKKDYSNVVDNDPTKLGIKKEPIIIISNLFSFIKDILSIRDNSIDYGKVIKEMKDSIVFKGYNVWVLIFSIIIASVGLNVDSVAVIIGAMLISPLMGPIRGIGFGIAMNDFALLIKSLKNFGITVGVSVATSVIYFLISPINQTTEQLFLRTEPTFLDVVIAFAGGLAGVIAAVKGRNDTVIPGVAIATALMPPLCTAGFGIATGQWVYFIGAFYLFLINSLLITLSTLFIIRYLKFPKVEYINPKIEKKVQIYISIFMFVMIAPSTYLFYNMTKKSMFESNAQLFVKEVVEKSTNGKTSFVTGYDSDSSFIDVIVQGDYVNNEIRDIWKKQKSNYDLEDVFINVYSEGDYKSYVNEQIQDFVKTNTGNEKFAQIIIEKDKKIEELYNLLENQKNNKTVGLDVNDILQEFKIDYPEVRNARINQSVGLNLLNKNDTTYNVSLRFSISADDETKEAIKQKVSKKMKYQLNKLNFTKQDSIPVYEY